MNAQIEKIRQLLSELESLGVSGENDSDNSGSLPAAEMSVVIQEIVDDLQPLLTPYEIALYWHLFRHSIASTGNSLVRVSFRGLRKIAKSIRSDAVGNLISENQIQTSLRALASMGAIRARENRLEKARYIGS